MIHRLYDEYLYNPKGVIAAVAVVILVLLFAFGCGSYKCECRGNGSYTADASTDGGEQHAENFVAACARNCNAR